jgi:mono/diheme cytochrome c family protein
MSAEKPNSSDSQKLPPNPRLDQPGTSDENLHKVHSILMREKEEPSEGFSPVPIFFLFIFSGLIFWGGVYLAKYSGGFDPLVYDETARPVVEQAGAAEVDLVALGRRLYSQQCAACHQPTGLGVAGVFPPLVDSRWVEGNEEVPIRILLHGMVGPVVVRGNTYNGNMPAFGAQLNDQRLAAILTFIRQEWGNEASEVTPERVAQTRAAVTRAQPWTAAELEPLFEE